MNRRMVAGCLAWLALLNANAWAQTGSACKDGKPFSEWYRAEVDGVVETAVPNLAEKAARDTPRAAAMSTQNSAPSLGGTLATIVDTAGFTELLSAAFDQRVGSDSSDAVTLNVNPFTFAAIGNPAAYYDQVEYEKTGYSLVRRLAATASFGGNGESFDRDGDGEADPALASEHFDDIVGWEIRFNVYGTRDRRSRGDFLGPDNFGRLVRATRDGLASLMTKEEAILVDSRFPFNANPASLETNRNMCMTQAEWDALRNEEWFRQKLEVTTSAAVALNRRYADAADEIDNQMLWTVAVTGLQRGPRFGADKLGLAVRSTWGGFSFNFDWKRLEGVSDADDSNQYTVGAKYATQILKGQFWTDGVDASASAAYDRFDNVPDAKHDSNVKIQGRLDIPVMQGLTVPLSVTWANHRDLLDDGDEVIGHFGINVDISKLLPAGGET